MHRLKRGQTTTLQWSHAQSSVETSDGEFIFTDPYTLQWSHAQSSVETRKTRKETVLRHWNFNGATLNQAWKRVGIMHLPRSDDGLQWSHAQSSVETIAYRFVSRRAMSTSMEPRSIKRGNCGRLRVGFTPATHPNPPPLNQAWKHLIASLSPHQPRYFNGATLNQAWKRGHPDNSRRREVTSMEPRSIKRGNSSARHVRLQPEKHFNGATLNQAWKHRC